MSTTLKNKTVTTRKEHQCFSCYRKFPAGTKMNYYVGIVDGDFSTVYSCMTCVQIMSHSEPDWDEAYQEGFVADELNKGQTPEDILAELLK